MKSYCDISWKYGQLPSDAFYVHLLHPPNISLSLISTVFLKYNSFLSQRLIIVGTAPSHTLIKILKVVLMGK